jgi:CRP-like cAMP-binding protein
MNVNGLVTLLENRHWLSEAFTSKELSVLFDRSSFVTYRKRETIVKRGEFIIHLPLLISGYVMLEVDDGKKNLILDIYKGINVIGLPLVLSLEKYNFSVVTLTDAEVVFVPLDFFKTNLESNGKLAKAIINEGNNHFVIPMLDKLKSVSQNNIRGRLAKLILHFAKDTFLANNFTLLTSRNEMAQMIGFSRENVIRILTEFDEEGIIKVKSKSIEILDYNKLDELAKYS